MSFMFWVCIVLLIWTGIILIGRIHERIVWNHNQKLEAANKLIREKGEELLDLLPRFRREGHKNITSNLLIKEFGYGIQEAFLSIYSVIVVLKEKELLTPVIAVHEDKETVHEIPIEDDEMLNKLLKGIPFVVEVNNKEVICSLHNCRIFLKVS
jgi:hypothetical protein